MNEASWQRALVGALEASGLVVVSDFRIPGTRRRVDIYLPQIPSAAVEIKLTVNPDATQSATTQARAFLSELVRVFGGQFEMFVVTLNPQVRSEAVESGCLHWIPGTEGPEPAADRITEVLKSRRRSLDLMPHGAAPRWTLPLDDHRSDGTLLARNGAEESTPPYAGRYGIRQKVEQILLSLRDLVSASSFDVIENEVAQLVAEYEGAHYTSCALRGGRALEFVVYSVAKAWGVQVDEQMLTLIHTLQADLRAINQRILALRDTPATKQVAARAEVNKLALRLSGRIAESLLTMDDVITEGDVQDPSPRNVEALLRDIKRQHGRHEVVRTVMQQLLDEGLVRDVLAIRNAAAHASPEGEAREVAKDEVEAMLDDVVQVLHLLTNCGRSIGGTRS